MDRVDYWHPKFISHPIEAFDESKPHRIIRIRLTVKGYQEIFPGIKVQTSEDIPTSPGYLQVLIDAINDSIAGVVSIYAKRRSVSHSTYRIMDYLRTDVNGLAPVGLAHQIPKHPCCFRQCWWIKIMLR